jgi:hypothetical protein
MRGSAPIRSHRRQALLLEVLIAMALLASVLGVLWRGPVLLWRGETDAWRMVALQWEVDRQAIHAMSRLVQGGPRAVSEEPVPIEVGLLGCHGLMGLLQWHVREASPVEDPMQSSPPSAGRRYLLIARVEMGSVKDEIQRSLFLEEAE